MLRVDIDQVELALEVHGSVLKRLDYRQVGVHVGGVLANQCKLNWLEILGDVNGLLPEIPQLGTFLLSASIQRNLVELETLVQKREQTLLLKKDRDLVDCLHVMHANDLVEVNLAAEGDLLDGGIVEGGITPAGNKVWHQTRAPELSDGVLGGLGLLLSVDQWNEGDVDVEEGGLGISDELVSQLHQGLYERPRLEITNGTTQLDDADIWRRTRVIDWDLGNPLNGVVDLLDDVRHDLDGSAKVVSPSLFLLWHRNHVRPGRGCRFTIRHTMTAW